MTNPRLPGRIALVTAALAACGPATVDSNTDAAATPDTAALPDRPAPPLDAAPPPDAPPPPMDRPPPPDAPPPPMDRPPPPDDAPPPPDAGAPVDRPVAVDVPPAVDVPVAPTDSGASCASPGTPTLATPPTAATATSNFNVTLNACTRTARALECALGVGHRISIVVDGAVRRITANGVPNHDVGDFPNPDNPNAISAQSYSYAVPVTPSGAGATATVFGITLSGVVLDPGTAEVWNDSTSWRYEALRYATAPGYFSGAGATDTTRHPTALGLDCNFAHVQPTGAYHYHGVPTGLMPSAPALTFVGWAGDGYPIFGRWDRSTASDPSSPLAEMRSSYRLRTGTRPSGTAGPGGTYDGTFVQDWEYAAGTGDLDECNGRTGSVVVGGAAVTTYHYVLTNTFPYIPRCFHATPDASFTRGMMMMGGGDAGVPATDAGMGPIACTTAAQCTTACPPGSYGCTCATTMMGMRCVPTCRTAADCPMPMGMTLQCRSGVCSP